MRLFILTILLSSLTCISCNKKGAGSNDSIQPVITMTDPVNNQVYAAGDMIFIRGAVTDDQFIAEIHIHVSDLNTGALLMDVHRYPAGPGYTLNEFIVASAATDYKIQVIARDRGVNEAITTIFVSGN